MSNALTLPNILRPASAKAASAGSLALASQSMLPGQLGNIDAYIQAVNRIPLLTPEEERQYATEYRDGNNLDAARQLVLSHLRLVVSIARNYLGYGLPHGDLIQEGNIGLMKAVKRFDPAQNVRLVSYAIHWIKAEIHEYILRNWRMVKVATTKAQRKLFFNLRSHKKGTQAFTPEEIDGLAQELNVKREEVAEMETRLSGGDIALEGQIDDGEESYAPIAYLADSHNEPTAVLAARQRDMLQTDGIARALESLDARSRRIIEARWLNVGDDGSGGSTLHDLAAEFGVSAERIRQIEASAMKKMRTALAAYA
ncbi:RNA polymerase sigma factor RpoH [Burkholderia oklahomensis]|uniref:RNA polymerase sigma factor RpoH n=1 Tax=Burkholderia oklahomensis TaxID=342113 RepID=A0AAI8B4N6_9BURK|nr:RNA polymerase sigma factor RpoH [Burkholderia oklahomensis]AIO66018.1 alternative sigma factor RpoH [Burkholderia oklahomensis]AJX30269.1 alternative sigma factor RpoH [Burkholderia oklahomensis C6786]AOI43608.1 RNA polymerase factor sigma-32 [Burkholderia oklahomensis EO147]AOI47196.1 RNA polymerase factor sigma-32 [Burkholderia oklahomensis C6786]KUY49252.1 RNA polymerase factor sigma-32 [Burkholderia oklahomensis EO147]